MPSATQLNGKKIIFPEVKRFEELFPTAVSANGESPRLLETESWECGTWSDRQRKTRSYTSGYCKVEGEKEMYFLHVTATAAVLEWIRVNMLAVPNDTKHFEIYVYSDGTALVTCAFSTIIGSYFLAIIDASSIPRP